MSAVLREIPCTLCRRNTPAPDGGVFIANPTRRVGDSFGAHLVVEVDGKITELRRCSRHPFDGMALTELPVEQISTATLSVIRGGGCTCPDCIFEIATGGMTVDETKGCEMHPLNDRFEI